jgi:leader peptidase (prepilin peptidase)/N-methyltransferase
MRLAELSPTLLRFVGAVLGLLWGSFVNVVVHRVPLDESVVRPGSRCPHCGKPIGAIDNVPVVSWLLLRGRSRCCRRPISVRYPLVELLCGFLGLGIVDLVVLRLPPDVPVSAAAVLFVLDFALGLALVAAAFIDLEHMFLPDSITIGGTLLGFVTGPLRGVPWLASGLGAVLAFALVYFPLVIGYRVLRGKTGMGTGDAKLLGLAGAWFGFAGALFVLLAGALQGTLAALVLWLFRGRIQEPEAVRADREELKRLADEGDEEAKLLLEEDPLGDEPEEGFFSARLPFGPFLILGILELMLVGPELDALLGGLIAL